MENKDHDDDTVWVAELSKLSPNKHANYVLEKYKIVYEQNQELRTLVQKLQFKITQLEKAVTTPTREKRASRSDSGSSNKPNQPKINDPPPPGPSTLQTENNDTKVKKVPALHHKGSAPNNRATEDQGCTFSAGLQGVPHCEPEEKN